jgi:hypothetical protein
VVRRIDAVSRKTGRQIVYVRQAVDRSWNWDKHTRISPNYRPERDRKEGRT